MKIGIAVIVIAVLIGALLQQFASSLFVRCSYGQQSSAIGTQLIGLIGDIPRASCSFAEDLWSSTQPIIDQNRLIEEKSEQYQTIIFIAPLTIPVKYNGLPADGFNNQGVKAQLEGLRAAQQQFNRTAAIKLRILIMNAGVRWDFSQYAVDIYLQPFLQRSGDEVSVILSNDAPAGVLRQLQKVNGISKIYQLKKHTNYKTMRSESQRILVDIAKS